MSSKKRHGGYMSASDDGKKKILLVQDTVTITNSLFRLLKKHGTI